MKFLTTTFLVMFMLLSNSLNTGCRKSEFDARKLVNAPIYPGAQPNELNTALIISGNMVAGNIPQSVNPDQVKITVSVPSASITNDNFLFLPFSFDVDAGLKGIYLQVEGADNYWDAPVGSLNPGANSFAIAIGIPAYVQEGNFVVSYKLYDTDNNISAAKSINVSIVASENRCGSGQGFPRVEGEDGITVKTYDFGDEPGMVEISYYMYTQKDRMDIRYNGEWIRSTSPQLLKDGEAPPFKKCDEATSNEGFVSGGGTFSIPYDPNINREISIYVSGCLEGGTLWYFDVNCPVNSNPPGVSICGNSTAQDSYDKKDPQYHHYPEEGSELTTVICDPSVDPDCTLAAVFNTMLKQSNFIAPTNDESPVKDCKVTWVNIVTSRNPVISKINYPGYSVTNYTIANEVDEFGIERTHLLHPGKVTRTVEMINGKIVVSTEGEGTGWAPSINEYFSSFIWGGVDSELKEYWDEN